MNKKLDFYNGKGASQTVDNSAETYRRMGNKKLGLIVALAVAILTDVLVATLLGVVTKKVTYFLAPVGLAIVDAVFLADIFFINLKQRYTIGHRVLYILFSVVLAFVTAMIPTSDDKSRVMTTVAMFIFIGVQAAKLLLVIVLYHLDKRSEFSLKERVASIVLVVFLTGILASYSLFNYNVGFMGQGVKFGDENATLIYSLTEKGEYEVVGSFHDGGVITVPETFDGKKVTSVDCSFIDASVTKIVVEGKELKFRGAKDIKALYEDITVMVHKENVDAVRLGLFIDCWTSSGDATPAKTLFDSVTPIDLGASETYYNVSCTDAFTSGTVGYIPTVFKNDGSAVTLNDIKGKMEPAKRQLFERTDISDQGDLKYCFENNNRMILTRGDAEGNDFFLTLEPIYKFTLGTEGFHGNDEKWIPAPYDRERYSVSSGLANYYLHLPKRDGFSVAWSVKPLAESAHAVSGAEDFAAYVLGSTDENTFDLRPEWSILPPTVSFVPMEDIVITYGQNAEFSLRTECVFPVKYILKTPSGTKMDETEPRDAGLWSYAMPNKVPANSGAYTLVMTATPSTEVTSLGASEAVLQVFGFTVNKKTLSLNWVLPSGEFNNAERSVLLSYEEGDRVGSDVIELTRSLTSAKNAGNYHVTATMDSASSEKYVFLTAGEHAYQRDFTIDKKKLTVNWSEMTYTYNGEVQYPVATTTVFDVVESLTVSGGSKKAGNYTAVALAKEVGDNHNGVDIDTDNYVIGENPTKAYTIAKKTVEVTSWTTDSYTYDGTLKSSEVAAMSGYIEGEEEVAFSDLVYQGNAEKNAGDHPFTVTFGIESNYTFGVDAPTVAHTLHVEPKVISYSWVTTSLDYNGEMQHPVAQADSVSLCGNDTCAFYYEGEGMNAGNYEVTVTGVTNPNYKLADGDHTQAFVINKILRPAFTVTYADRTYGDETPTPVVSGNAEDGEVTYLYRKEGSGIYSSLPPTLAGNYVITATSAESANYLETSAEHSFKINKKRIVVSWTAPASLEYDKAAKEPTASVSNRVGTDDVSVTIALSAGGDNVNVGSFTFTATALLGEDKENYTLTGAAGTVSPAYTITPHVVTLSWQELSASELVYDKTAKSVTASPVGVYAGDDCEAETVLNSGNNVNVGSFTFRATLTNANYTLASAVSGGYTITPKSVTVAVKDAEVGYGSAAPEFGLDTSALIAGDTLTGTALYSTEYDTSDPLKRGVGSYDVTVSGLSNANYDITFEKGVLTVSARAVALSWDFTYVVYDKAEHLPVAAIANRAFAADEIGFVYDTDVPETNVGSYSRTVTALSGGSAGNYTLSGGLGVSNSWSILQKAVTVKPADVTITYGEGKPEFTLDLSALIAGDTLTGDTVYNTDYDTSQWAKRKAGSYDVTVSATKRPSNPNYSVTFVKGALTVRPRPVVLSWSEDSYEYDGETHRPIATITNKQYEFDDAISLTYDSFTQMRSVGNYTRTVTGFSTLMSSYGNNFTVEGGTNVTHSWSITPKAVTVKVKDTAVTYGDAPAYSVDTSALYSGDHLTGTAHYTCAYDASDPAHRAIGSYDVTVSGLANPNYDLTFDKGTLTVGVKAIELWVNNVTVTYGDPTPAFSVDTSVLLAGDTLSGTAVFDTLYVPGDATYGVVGDYAVSFTGLSNANYDITRKKGKLTVVRATRGAVTVDIADVEVGEPITPTVTSAIEEEGGTTVTYLYGVQGSVSEPTSVPPAEEGDYYVIARLSASDNYSEAQSEPCLFTVYSV